MGAAVAIELGGNEGVMATAAWIIIGTLGLALATTAMAGGGREADAPASTSPVTHHVSARGGRESWIDSVGWMAPSWVAAAATPAAPAAPALGRAAG